MHGEMRKCSQVVMKHDFLSNVPVPLFVHAKLYEFRVLFPVVRTYTLGEKECWYVAHPPCNFVGLFTDRRDAEDYVNLLQELSCGQ